MAGVSPSNQGTYSFAVDSRSSRGSAHKILKIRYFGEAKIEFPACKMQKNEFPLNFYIQESRFLCERA